jgi:hypothetical protein
MYLVPRAETFSNSRISSKDGENAAVIAAPARSLRHHAAATAGARNPAPPVARYCTVDAAVALLRQA